MIVVGVVSELRHAPGVYGRSDERVGAAQQQALKEFAAAAAAVSARTTLSSVALAVSPILAGGLLAAGVGVLGVAGWYLLTGHSPLQHSPLKRVGDVPRLPLNSPDLARELLIVPGAFLGGDFGGHKDPYLYGLFGRATTMRSVFSAEGGNVDLWIISQTAASKHFSHYGGNEARFSPGLHLPHPKDPKVLVPISDYSTRLYQEVRQEWIRVFEALGAKRIVVADTTDGKLGFGFRGKPQGVDIAADLRATYGESCVDESRYAAGTFDATRARTGRRWLGEHPEIATIVEGRIDGRQESWRRTLTVDASFGIDVSVLTAVGASMSASLRRTIDFYVEFFPK